MYAPAASLAATKTFNGECGSGKKLLMYNGGGHDGDNPGSIEAQVTRCSAACRGKKTPADGKNWTGFFAAGFILIPESGRCLCEDTHSQTCAKISGEKSIYDRYDWTLPPGL